VDSNVRPRAPNASVNDDAASTVRVRPPELDVDWCDEEQPGVIAIITIAAKQGLARVAMCIGKA
jgi:hypothetical protein